MTVTVARVSGPLVSWGEDAKFRHRGTAPSPTHSALTGLLAAAAGIGRGEPWPSWVSDAPQAVRMDRPGSVLRDFHTINPAPTGKYRQLSKRDRSKVVTLATAEGAARKDPLVTERFYRQDAEAVVFFDDPQGLVEACLAAPRWAIYGGRKGAALSFPLLLGRWSCGVEEALTQVPSPAPAGAPLAAQTFFEPQTHPTLRTEERLDVWDGAEHRPGRRWHIEVDPPRMDGWFDLKEDGR